jgi:hypothetical protein
VEEAATEVRLKTSAVRKRSIAAVIHGGFDAWKDLALMIAAIALKTERIVGRGERIRTSGLLVPNQALYQAEPRPEESAI